MQVEIYPDPAAFCQTPAYQEWLAQWRPPRPAQVDLWVHHEQELRPQLERRTPRWSRLTRAATRLPFHFLDSLEIGALPCVDIGCGLNWFKAFYPTIRGVDPRNEQHRDEELTPAWWIPNWARWPRAFSVCAMHFFPQGEIAQQIAKVRGLLTPGGRAFVALNRARIREQTADYQELLLRDQLAQTPGLARMVWLDQPASAQMDGNVWLWLGA